MKQIITLLAIVLGGQLFTQIISIPDANFKQQLIGNQVDINYDGEIQVSEALTL